MDSRKTSPFILRFVSRISRDNVIRNAKMCKPTAAKFGGSSDVMVFYNEHLLFHAKKMRDSHFVWTKNGMVMCREKKENAVAIRITSIEEIKRMSGAGATNGLQDSRKRALRKQVH